MNKQRTYGGTIQEPPLTFHSLHLANNPSGIACDETGLRVGGVAILANAGSWCVRPRMELNGELSRCYGLPIDVTTKTKAFDAVANALNRGRCRACPIGGAAHQDAGAVGVG